jgi:hypothetical protein
MKTYTIAVIPGDGIGNEVMLEGLRVLDRVAEIHGGIAFSYQQYEWGCEYYTKTGNMMADDGMDRLRDTDGILLGAVGYPGVPDHISLRDLLLRIRQGFNQYVNLRPIKLITEADCPLKGMGPADIDMIFVRENTEGEYAGVGGITREGTAEEMALQTSIFTRKNTEKVMDYAFNLARERLDLRRQAGRKTIGKVTSATKSNALNYGMVFWDKLFAEGETFKIGNLDAKVMLSPGHTLASITYVIGDAAFIHDTLFMPDSGTARADFPGGDAGVLYRSIQAILALPDETRLFTGHDYQPNGREAMWESTVAEQKAKNTHMSKLKSEAEYVAVREARDRTLPMPKLILHALQINTNGGRLPEPESNGRRYLKFPLDALEGAVWG